jgi:hypothetical protein
MIVQVSDVSLVTYTPSAGGGGGAATGLVLSLAAGGPDVRADPPHAESPSANAIADVPVRSIVRAV